uniref:Putative ribonuclease H-like domain-containing protein n=1 Tax=Tanacetum cinerariifolium TaxID=118510 RepID=A0A6L2JPC0_TANCI|nr:putative ribonuclease H-like domain-containing protein [Tanacetum cinerariifolium]
MSPTPDLLTSIIPKNLVEDPRRHQYLLEDQGSGPTWLFDIDTLTHSMNYQPVVARNQPNHNAGIQENLNAGKVGKETESAQQYMLLPLWSTGLKDPQNIDVDAAFDVKENESRVYVSPSNSDKPKKHDDKTKREAIGKSHVDLSIGVINLSDEFKDFSFNSTNRVNATSAPVTAVGPSLTNNTNSFNAASPYNNAVSLTFNFGRKSSFVDPSQYPNDPDMPALEDIIYSDDEEDVGAEADFSTLKTSITVSPIPTIRVHKDHPVTQIIGDLSSALRQRVWQGWNKAWLVAQGHTQEECIDYEEVFAPVARIESIQLFLAYASFMGFMVYQMDVKSVFIYETIEEEIYVCQPLGFKDPDYLDKVYKVVKALYGLHQAPRAWYETLANYLLENGFQRGKINQTLFIKKQRGDILLVQVYVDDIIFGSTNKELCKAFKKLMNDKFQMSSMGELTFFFGLQIKKKDDGIFISQDKYVAKILRKFGLIDGKSASTPIDTQKPLLKDPDSKDVDVHMYMLIIGSLMYLTSSRLDIMFAICACARFQVTSKVSHLHAVKRIFRYLKGKPHLGLWYLKDSSFNLVAYSDSDYARARLDRKSTTGGCQFLGCRLISWQCKKKTFVVTSSTKAEYVSNDVVKFQALIDRKKVIITEDTFRQDLQLDDVDGVDCLPNEEIFAELARIGYEKPSNKLTFYKVFFYAQWKFLIHTVVQCMSAKRTAWNEFSSSIASAIICLATGRKFKFSKYIIDNMVRNVDSPSKFIMYPRFLQVMINAQINYLSSHNTKYPSPALTHKVFANMRRIGKGFSGVETPLFDTMLVQPQVQDVAEVEEDKDANEEPAAHTSSSPKPPQP